MDTSTWPGTILVLGLAALAVVLIGAGAASFLEFRKDKLAARQTEDLRQLVRRYEQLAENSLDAQQRVAANVAELRTRTQSIEKILRTVE